MFQIYLGLPLFLICPGIQKKMSNNFQKIFNLIDQKRQLNKTPIMVENPRHMKRKTHVFDRGNWLKKIRGSKIRCPTNLKPMG